MGTSEGAAGFCARQTEGLSLPNFLVIGAARSGTTAVVSFLSEHPQAFVSSPKEPHFLAFAGEAMRFCGPGDEAMVNRVAVTDHACYQRLFRKAGGKRAIGEGSVSTLYYADKAVENIRRYTPAARMIAILRNPVERAYSSFLYTTAQGYEPLRDFDAALDAEPERIAAGWHHLWHYTQMGFYSSQLPHFFEAFGRERVKVILHDDLRNSPAGVLAGLTRFLGIDPRLCTRSLSEANRSGVPRNRAFPLLTKAIDRRPAVKGLAKTILPMKLLESVRNAGLSRPPMSENSRERLQRLYREEIGQLQELLNRNLQPWLTRGA